MRTANLPPLNRAAQRAAAQASRSRNDGRPLLTIDEGAEYLKISRRSVYRHIHSGLLRATKTGKNGALRLRPCDLDDFVEQHMAS